MRGAKQNPRSRRARLATMAPGDVELFPALGVSYKSLSSAVTSDLARHFEPVKLEFSMRRALLVFDETMPPIAVCVVTRQKEAAKQ